MPAPGVDWANRIHSGVPVVTPVIVGAIALALGFYAFFLRGSSNDDTSNRSGGGSGSGRRRSPPPRDGSLQPAEIAVEVDGHVQHIRERRDRGPDRRMGVGLASELWAVSGQPDRRKRNRGRRTHDVVGAAA